MRWAVLLLVLLLGGCARPTLERPPDIRYGSDTCDGCGMIISEARYATAVVTPCGQVHRFDDVSDMVTWLHGHPGGHVWVHDVQTSSWLPGEQAGYLEAESFRTPMGHHLVAFASPSEAARQAHRCHGRATDFNTLKENKP